MVKYYKDMYTMEDLKFCGAGLTLGWIIKFECKSMAPDKNVMGRWINRLTVTPERDWKYGPSEFVEWMSGFTEVKK